jgi:hypothetical protein
MCLLYVFYRGFVEPYVLNRQRKWETIQLLRMTEPEGHTNQKLNSSQKITRGNESASAVNVENDPISSLSIQASGSTAGSTADSGDIQVNRIIGESASEFRADQSSDVNLLHIAAEGTAQYYGWESTGETTENTGETQRTEASTATTTNNDMAGKPSTTYVPSHTKFDLDFAARTVFALALILGLGFFDDLSVYLPFALTTDFFVRFAETSIVTLGWQTK